MVLTDKNISHVALILFYISAALLSLVGSLVRCVFYLVRSGRANCSGNVTPDVSAVNKQEVNSDVSDIR